MNRALRRAHVGLWLVLAPVALALLIAGVRAALSRAGALNP